MNGAATLGRMAESSATEPIEVLRARLQLDGFLLLRGLLPRDAVDAGRRRIAAGLESAGWLAPGSRAGALLVDTANLVHDSAHPPANIGGLETQQFLRQSELVRVLRAPELEDFFTRLFGERSACFDFKWFRAIRPGAGQGFHCDNIYMGRGSSDLHTAWIPWMDVPISLGGLAVIEGSHRLPGFEKIRNTYCEYDTQRTGVVEDAPAQDGWLSADPAELLRFDQAARWVTSDFYAGDVVVFPMKLLHGSVANRSQSTLRLSCDVRYQPASHPHDERYSVGASPGEQAAVDQQRMVKGFGGLDARKVPRVVTMVEQRKRWGIAPRPRL